MVGQHRPPFVPRTTLIQRMFASSGLSERGAVTDQQKVKLSQTCVKGKPVARVISKHCSLMSLSLRFAHLVLLT